jgi:hypothetical protein
MLESSHARRNILNSGAKHYDEGTGSTTIMASRQDHDESCSFNFLKGHVKMSDSNVKLKLGAESNTVISKECCDGKQVHLEQY